MTPNRAEQAAHWPIGRIAIGTVIAGWLVITLAALIGWVSWDAAAFLAAAAFTFAIAAVLGFDAAMDQLDPDERGTLPARFQAEKAWSWLLRAPAELRVIAIPAFFAAGTVTGHFLWH